MNTEEVHVVGVDVSKATLELGCDGTREVGPHKS